MIYQPRTPTCDWLVEIIGDSEPTDEISLRYFFAREHEVGGQHCLVSMDSGLEAFSLNPTHGSFGALAFQPAPFTNYANRVFLSY